MPIIISKAAQRFALDLNEPEALVDIECGLHSGIPKCCILFFVKVWRSWMDEEDRERIDSYWSTQKALGVEEPGYLPCPACLLRKNIVPVHRCTCGRQRSVQLARD